MSRIPTLAVAITVALTAAPGAQGPGMGPGGPNQPERKIVDQFDTDGNGRLDVRERQAAREFLASSPAQGRGFGPGAGRMGGRGPGPGGPQAGPAQPGPAMRPEEVPPSSAALYDDATLRTLFLTFEGDDWEAELDAFANTDVDVPATLAVDGRTYREVGVHFRGASSYFSVPQGYKKSLNLSMDFAHQDQDLGGYRTLNLNNANGDPSLMRAVLYAHIARHYVATPAANFVRVVINGEYYGVYTNVAQFNKDFLRDHFNTTDGPRWKVPGSPNGRGGLEYLGDDPSAYRRLYEIKTKDEARSWNALIQFTKVLNTVPADQLEATLAPLLDIDGTLKFLALENALVNSDGYWTRASDYSLYLDPSGRFHIIPHDINEAMMAGGPGGRGGRGQPGLGPVGPPPGGVPQGGRRGGLPPDPRGRGGRGGRGPGGPGMGGVTLDPMVAANDTTKPLLSRLLAVPALRERYLGHVREIATTWLDWSALGPIVDQYRSLIAGAVADDTKKRTSTADFERSVEDLKAFADGRRAFLLRDERLRATDRD